MARVRLVDYHDRALWNVFARHLKWFGQVATTANGERTGAKVIFNPDIPMPIPSEAQVIGSAGTQTARVVAIEDGAVDVGTGESITVTYPVIGAGSVVIADHRGTLGHHIHVIAASGIVEGDIR